MNVISLPDSWRPVIGTLAHNRAFTAREITEYTMYDRRLDGPAIVRKLLTLGMLEKVGAHTYAPTRGGWDWIERECGLYKALSDLVTRCDGAEGVRADGSNIDTCAAHAALGDFLPPFDCPLCGQHITDDKTCGCNGAPRVRRTVE